MVKVYTLEELIEVLMDVEFVNPFHVEKVSDGHGEFPDGYKLTVVGGERLKKELESKLEEKEASILVDDQYRKVSELIKLVKRNCEECGSTVRWLERKLVILNSSKGNGLSEHAMYEVNKIYKLYSKYENNLL